MRKTFYVLALASIVLTFTAMASAQSSRKSVSVAEVTGTFNFYFTGKFKGSTNEIKIQALGKGRLKVAFDLVYPFIDAAGEMSANLGQLTTEAVIKGDTAIIENDEFGECRIKIKFVRPGQIKVTQETVNCGFGNKVTADGAYRKTSSRKPKFEDNP